MNVAYRLRPGYVMDRIKIELENCYGIRFLKQTFDFSQSRAYALYAPNGAMKSSFAETFNDLANGRRSQDRIFPDRQTVRSVLDSTGKELKPESILVVKPYDEELGHTEKTSTLLVDANLRREYARLDSEIESSKANLINLIKQQSGSKKDFEQEISSAFTRTSDNFYNALVRIRTEVDAQKEIPFASVAYDKIFDDKVLAALNTKNLKSLVEDYVHRYNSLLDASTYFRRGTFDYYNAGEIARSLAANGFFSAKHTVKLNANGKTVEISTEKELEQIIAGEKEAILTDNDLRKKFDDVAKALAKNVNLRDFVQYMQDNVTLLSHLINLDKFKEDILKSYLRANYEAYAELMKKYSDALQRRGEIEEEARKQRTLWERVIEEFNNRFFVPFKLEAKNRIAVMLGQKAMIDLGFVYKDGSDTVEIGRKELLKALSTGEKRAFYILNVLFEIEARRKAQQETLVVVDDIADSFDYQNKYAIIQYLKDINEDGLFKQIIMTHNFDFFRTIESRFVKYNHCLMATKDSSGIKLQQAIGIRNVFVKDWKENFDKDPKKKIASIPFVRNLVEYCEGEHDEKFEKLTSLLHWKADTTSITVGELDRIYHDVCKKTCASNNPNEIVYDVIEEQAKTCLAAPTGINFENKIVLAIATRLKAEQFMISKIKDKAYPNTITHNQTYALAARFKKDNPNWGETSTLDRVLLMTPENIHLNSFMYEPIVDMSDEHLKKLYTDVHALS